jgi:cytochrome c-type biogenesis protein CcmF
MAELGNFALILCLFLSSYAILIDIFGSLRGRTELNKSAGNAVTASFGCLTLASAILWILLIRSDFTVSYVAENTSKALPFVYKLSALWAGAGGSLLLWLWLQTGFAVMAFTGTKLKEGDFFANARVIINLVNIFFLLVLIFDKNPFTLTKVKVSDGAGLNPLLQHPAMALHPPALFIGYAAFAIPFAWSFASLKWDNSKGRAPLLRQVRIWTLAAWLFLTIGIALGAWWAYEELGWGGYWAWDPVENSSLMPWLTATALLHCFSAYRRDTSVARWLILLTLGTFSLCVFGTFLTRYGLVSSVHAFPEPGLGILFMVLLLLVWIIAAILALVKSIQSKSKISSVRITSQKFIVMNNWLMILLMFVIFVGTLFPFFSGLFSKNQITLKPGYFTKITAPGGLLLLLLLSVCPYLVRFGINKSLRTVGAAIAAISALAGLVITDKLAPAVFILSGFAILSLAGDFINRMVKNRTGNRDRSKTGFNLRWYGARIVHIGVVMVFIGIAGSGGYGHEEQVALKKGSQAQSAGFNMTFEGLKADHGPNYTSVRADIIVEKDGSLFARMHPSQAFYSDSGKRTSEVDIRRSLAGDLYLALNQVDSTSGLINLNVMVKPLIDWIWIGCIVSICGTIIVLISFYLRRKTASDIEGEINDE